MEYIVTLKNGNEVKIDYDCWGVLSCLDIEKLTGWRGTFEPLNGWEWKWDNSASLEDYLKPEDIATISWEPARPVHAELFDTPFMKHIRSEDGLLVADVAGVPCDEIMSTLFILRDIYGVENHDEYFSIDPFFRLMQSYGFSVWECVVICSVWYRASNWKGEVRGIYSRDDDGSLFNYHRMGDVKAFMEGRVPQWHMGPFGTYPCGYPSEGFTESLAAFTEEGEEMRLRDDEGEVINIGYAFDFKEVYEITDERNTVVAHKNWPTVDEFVEYIRSL